jgi:glutathione synthase/RimK-type ligase-like ATP-grasp enzyme
MRRVIEACSPLLEAQGIRLSGFDFLGDVVCEINVYSTGGFRDAETFFGQPFSQYALEQLLAPPLQAPPKK